MKEVKEEKVVKFIHVPFFTSMWLKSNQDVFDLNNNCGVVFITDENAMKRYAELDPINTPIKDLRNICPTEALLCMRLISSVSYTTNTISSEGPKLGTWLSPVELRDAIVSRKYDRTEIDSIIKSLEENLDPKKGKLGVTAFKFTEDKKDIITEEFIKKTFDFTDEANFEMFKKMFYVINGFKIK